MERLVERYAAIPQGQRFMAVALIVGVLCGAHYYFVYQDQDIRRVRYQNEQSKKITERSELSAVKENRGEYEAKLSEHQALLDKARRQLPDEANIPQLLAQLGNSARQAGLQIDEFTPQDEVDKGFYAEIPFAVRVNGSYHEIAIFIDAVGRLDRIMNVHDLQLRDPKSADGKVAINGIFRIRTFRFKKKADDAKAQVAP